MARISERLRLSLIFPWSYKLPYIFSTKSIEESFLEHLGCSTHFHWNGTSFLFRWLFSDCFSLFWFCLVFLMFLINDYLSHSQLIRTPPNWSYWYPIVVSTRSTLEDACTSSSNNVQCTNDHHPPLCSCIHGPLPWKLCWIVCCV